MGLDGVELVMGLEEAFGVELKDEEVVELTTPRRVIDLVSSKLELAQQNVCLSQRAFYLLRRALVEHVGAARNAIAPDTDLRGLIGGDGAKDIWPVLEQAVAARVWPVLVRPAVLVATLYLLTSIVFFVLLAPLLRIGVARAVGIALLGTLVFGLVALPATDRWRTILPSELRTVRDLVPYAGTSGQIRWTREKVALTVKMVVIEQLGLRACDYHADARFVEDLGLS